MKFFKNSGNQIFAYEDDVGPALIDPDFIEIPEVEAIELTSPQLTPAQTLQQGFEVVRLALNVAIEEKAVELGFPSGSAGLLRFAGYTNSYQALAEAFGAWEADVWMQANTYGAEVIEGNQPMLDATGAVALMPAFVAPAGA